MYVFHLGASTPTGVLNNSVKYTSNTYWLDCLSTDTFPCVYFDACTAKFAEVGLIWLLCWRTFCWKIVQDYCTNTVWAGFALATRTPICVLTFDSWYTVWSNLLTHMYVYTYLLNIWACMYSGMYSDIRFENIWADNMFWLSFQVRSGAGTACGTCMRSGAQRICKTQIHPVDKPLDEPRWITRTWQGEEIDQKKC